MTTTTSLGRCTWAACREPASTSTEQGWNFCDEHTAADAKLKAEQDLTVHRPASMPIPRATPATAGPVRTQPAPITVVPAASPIGRLLEDASGHSSSKVRNLAGRIETQLQQLRQVIDDQAEAEQTKQAEAKAKAAAKAEVERLERALADAKAKLRGPRAAGAPKATGSPRSASWTPERRAAQGERIRAANLRKATAPQEATQP